MHLILLDTIYDAAGFVNTMNVQYVKMGMSCAHGCSNILLTCCVFCTFSRMVQEGWGLDSGVIDRFTVLWLQCGYERERYFMDATGVVRARIDPGLKKEAAAVLSSMGLSMSDAIRLLMVRVVTEKALPFDVRIPNAETRAAMRDIEQGRVARFDSVSSLMADLNGDD